MGKDQLELGLENPEQTRPLPPAGLRRSRARWWFERMHEVVDRAFDWRSVPAARPEQVQLALAEGRS